MTTVLLVDDHVLFREGLRSLMSRWGDFDVVGEAADGAEALELARELLPDLVLMDVTMPVMDGLEATRRIVREVPTVRVVMLTVSEDQEDLLQALKNGAQGYLLKNTPSAKLVDYLRGVLRGESALSGAMATKVLAEFMQPRAPADALCRVALEPLSARELQVLQLVAEGLSNAEIGERLYLSENTVKKHLRNILQKLHLNNRVQVAVYAAREGLLQE